MSAAADTYEIAVMARVGGTETRLTYGRGTLVERVRNGITRRLVHLSAMPTEVPACTPGDAAPEDLETRRILLRQAQAAIMREIDEIDRMTGRIR